MGFFRVKFWSKRFFGVLFEALGIFFWGGGGGLIFASSRSSLSLEIRRPAPLGKNREEKKNPFQIVPTEQVGTLPVDFTTSNEKLSN